jgi:molecular chaperone DnaK
MVSQAEEHEAEDKRRRESIEAKNQLDTLIYSTEKSLGEYREKLEESDITELESGIESARKVLTDHSDDKEKLTEATEALTKAAHKLAEAMYKEANAGQEGGPEGAPGNGEPGQPNAQADAAHDSGDDVVDAEIIDD